MAASPDRTHYRTCNLCEAMCGIEIEFAGRDIVCIRGDRADPFSGGHICPKAPALQEIHEDPDRLRSPVRRNGGEWDPISWDEAFDLASRGLHRVQGDHGMHALAAYIGNPNVHNLGAIIFLPMLLRALRTKNRYSATSVDQLPHMLASYLMFGHQLLLPVPDIDRTDHLLMLGANPMASNGSLMTAPDIKRRLRAIRARGGRVVVVDPRRTETADEADEHVFIKPGSDALLLLALLHEALRAQGARTGHLSDLVTGLEPLFRVAARFPAERAAAHTGVEAETIRRMAAEICAADRAVCYGRLGTCTQRFGGLCQWLINSLNIVTGNMDSAGGAMFTLPAFDLVRVPAGLGVGRGSFGRWHSSVRSLPEFGGELPVAALCEEMLDAGDRRIRGLLTVAGNPVLSTPDGERLEEALDSLEFMVAVDPYINETTRHADVILPPTSPLERSHYDAVFHLLAVRNTAKYSAPAVAPEDSARHDWQIILALMKGLEDQRAGRISPAARIRHRALSLLGPEGLLDLGLRIGPYGMLPGAKHRRGLSLSRLKQAPHGIDLGPLTEGLLPDRLPEAHRLIQLAPEPFLADLERLEEAFPETRASDGGEPLLLIGRRHLRSNNSWMHNAKKLMAGRNRCTLMMHPDDALRLGVNDDERVVVRSRVGSVTVPVERTDAVMPGVVSLPHGYGHHREGARLRVAGDHAGVSINDLTDPAEVDLSGSAVLNGVPVTVARQG